MFTKRSFVAAALLVTGSTAFFPLAAQAGHVSVGIGIGYPGYAPPPPVVVVAPPPAYYYGAPTYYGGTAYYGPPPVVVSPGYWWYDQWGHRHWHER